MLLCVILAFPLPTLLFRHGRYVYILLSWLGVECASLLVWAGEIPALVGNDCAPLLLEGRSLRTSLLIGIRLNVYDSVNRVNYRDCTT